MAKKINVNTKPVYDAIAEAIEEPIPGQFYLDEEGHINEPNEEEQPKQENKEDTTDTTDTRGTSKHKERKTYTKEEALEKMEQLDTVGRKGLKLQRINMAFTPSNYEYITIMANVRGQSMTEFVNDIIRAARENNPEIYDQAKKFRESVAKARDTSLF